MRAGIVCALKEVPGLLRILGSPVDGLLPDLSKDYNTNGALWLGSGSIGTVLQVRLRQVPEERHALKIIPLSHLQQDYSEESLRNEVATMMDLRHENIVQIRGVYKHGGSLPGVRDSPPYLCIAMMCVAGNKLTQLLGKTQTEFVTLFAPQLISAVEYMHSRDICHRDIWPDNILVTCSGYVTVVDFGCASFYGSRKSSGIGTRQVNVHYAAPEVATTQLTPGGRWTGTPQQDCWSVGIVLGEIMVGHLVKALLDEQDIPLSAGHPIHQLFIQKLEGLCPGLGRLLEPDAAKRMTMRDARVLWDVCLCRNAPVRQRSLDARVVPRRNHGSPMPLLLDETKSPLASSRCPRAFQFPPQSPSPPQPSEGTTPRQSVLRVGQSVYYYSRHGRHYTGSISQRLSDGWLLTLDAQDAEGRCPVNKVVAGNEKWRIALVGSDLDTASLMQPASTQPVVFSQRMSVSESALQSASFVPPISNVFVPVMVGGGSARW